MGKVKNIEFPYHKICIWGRSRGHLASLVRLANCFGKLAKSVTFTIFLYVCEDTDFVVTVLSLMVHYEKMSYFDFVSSWFVWHHHSLLQTILFGYLQ